MTDRPNLDTLRERAKGDRLFAPPVGAVPALVAALDVVLAKCDEWARETDLLGPTVNTAIARQHAREMRAAITAHIETGSTKP